MASVIPGISTPESGPNLAWISTTAKSALAETQRHLLVLRFALINLVAMAMLGAAYMHGFVDMVFAGDQTRLSIVIFGVFVTGLVLCSSKVTRVSRELNAVRGVDRHQFSEAAGYMAAVRGRSGESRAMVAGALRLELSHRVAVVRHIANSLVLLGLIGTVIGFIIALSGVDPQKASEFESISPMISTLIEGMSTALYTTLVGGIFNLWLMVNYHLLATGTVKLISAIQHLGEEHGRA